MHPLIQKLIITLFTVICLFSSRFLYAESLTENQIMMQSIDKMHQAFSKNFFRTLIKQPHYSTLKFPSISTLQIEINKDKNNKIANIALIINNLNMIQGYYDDPAIFPLIEQLLKANELSSAMFLHKAINEQGDATLITQANYLLADFYFQRELWQQTIALLNADISLLSEQNYQHAVLIKGISLQKLSKHYDAIKEYEKIPAGSPYYNAAMLNLAITNLRLGWWTDGHIILKAQLKAQHDDPQEGTLNRLYITLAYSLLNQGYYRTARTTFHHVGIDSKYANQAILGIALTAAQQNDDIGALNATRFLKAKQQDDLPVHESYLLMPFFYEKSHQLVAASVGYSEASDYYTSKIATLNKVIATPLNLTQTLIPMTNHTELTLFDNVIDFSQYYPNYFFQNRTTMQAYQQQLPEGKLIGQYNELSEAYNALTIKMSKDILQNRVDNLNSYLNQSRFGLARLFDNNTAEQ